MKYRKLKNSDGLFVLGRKMFVNGKTRRGWALAFSKNSNRKRATKRQAKLFFSVSKRGNRPIHGIKGYRGWLDEV